jgi:hypothetical protein
VPDSGGEFQTATLGGLVFANSRIREPLAGQALALDASVMTGATLKASAAGEEGSPGSVTITFDKVPIRLTGTQTVTVSLRDVTLLANGDEQPIVAPSSAVRSRPRGSPMARGSRSGRSRRPP